MKKCRISQEVLHPVLDLGDIYLNNFLKKIDNTAPKGKLRLGFGKRSKLVQLLDTADQNKLYRNYWYRSGTNKTMTDQLREIVDIVPKWADLKENDVVLDIGCNDGTLLNHYNNIGKFFKIGIDPATNISSEGKKISDAHAVSFFNRKIFGKLTKRKAKVITSIAMFYDLDDPKKFVSDINHCLDKNGIWILQISYTPLMISLNAFDNIIHEHIEYYTLASLMPLFNRYKLEIIDAEINDVNAGSLRLVVKKKNNKMKNVAGFTKEIGKLRLESLILYEKKFKFSKKGIYLKFKNRIDIQKKKLLKLLATLNNKKKKVYGYGASTKGNTLLQYYKIDTKLVKAIAERQKSKHGLFTVGSWIPIISEESMRKINPDYLLVLPWQFIHEFVKREKNFLKKGGKFIVPLPEVKIIGYNET